MKWMLYILLALVGLLIILLLAAVIRAVLLKRKKRETPSSALDGMALDGDRYVKDLARMISYPTISRRDATDLSVFEDYRQELETLFPLIHERLNKAVMDDGSLLFHWQGKDSSKPAVVLMSHSDVVEATGKWSHPPFEGEVADGKIWGRGTMDTKGSLCAILEAVEGLLADGFIPPVDVYIASSCNEEIMGEGAPKTVRYLLDHGVKLDLVLDEGGAVVEAPMPGLTGHFAMLGILEKGYADVRFVARSKGGHSSTPPKNTPIARLAAFVNHVERHSPFSKKFTQPVKKMFADLAPDMTFPFRLLFGNIWLFGPLLKAVMPGISGQAGALLRTTCAFTMAEGSGAPNVIPETASVTANLRFMVHQPMEESLEKLRSIAARFDVEMEVLEAHDCSPVVDTTSAAYRYVESCLRAVYPEAGIAPYVMLGGTDARHYAPYATAVRFAPLVISGAQMAAVHGRDENIDTDALTGAVGFYRYLLEHYRI